MHRWDALLYGERKYILSPPATKANVMRTFHLRAPNVVMAEGFTTDESFIKRFKDRIRYLINIVDSSWNDPTTGKITHCSTMGYTEYMPQYNFARITFATQMISPLLRSDLSHSQRLVIQYRTAKTVSRRGPFYDLKLTPEPDPSRVRRKFIMPIDLQLMPCQHLE